jgi:hypothetical protein
VPKKNVVPVRCSYLCAHLLEGVPGVAGVRPPLEGVLLLVPGVPGVPERPCALPARGRPGVPAVRLGVPAGVRPTLGPEDRRFPRPPFGSMLSRD